MGRVISSNLSRENPGYCVQNEYDCRNINEIINKLFESLCIRYSPEKD